MNQPLPRANIKVEAVEPGGVRFRVDGDLPTHPWIGVLDPKTAYAVGCAFIVNAFQANGGQSINFPLLHSQSDAQPQRRPPNVQNRSGQGGPQSSSDGVPAASQGPPKASGSAPPLPDNPFGGD